MEVLNVSLPSNIEDFDQLDPNFACVSESFAMKNNLSYELVIRLRHNDWPEELFKIIW